MSVVFRYTCLETSFVASASCLPFERGSKLPQKRCVDMSGGFVGAFFFLYVRPFNGICQHLPFEVGQGLRISRVELMVEGKVL